MADEVGNFPRTKRDSEQGNAPIVFNVPGSGVERSVAAAILAETRLQTGYLRNVNRLVNFVWAGLIAVVALAVTAIVAWVLIVSVASR